jgi:hypothetical protein
MSLRFWNSATALFALAGLVMLADSPASAQQAPQKAPRLSNGKVDLSGVWDHPRVGDMAKNYQGKCAGNTPGCTSVGAPELDSLYTPFAKAENAKEPKFDYGVHCLPWGYVRSWNTPYPVELMQNANKLAILFEQNNMFHVVPTDGRPFPKDMEPTWLGTSVGHYEGETLVIETRGFNGKTWLDTEKERLTSDAMTVSEKFDRPDFNHIHHEITVTDPKMYTKPFKNVRVYSLMKPGEEILEYSCEENNKEIMEGHITDSWTKGK